MAVGHVPTGSTEWTPCFLFVCWKLEGKKELEAIEWGMSLIKPHFMYEILNTGEFLFCFVLFGLNPNRKMALCVLRYKGNTITVRMVDFKGFPFTIYLILGYLEGYIELFCSIYILMEGWMIGRRQN